jgi:ceramide glucosyltransferase
MTALLGAAAVLLLAIHLASLWWLDRRLRRKPALAEVVPPITLLRPICGLDHAIEATLGSSFRLDGGPAEIIFCAAHADDPAVAVARRLIAGNPQVPARILFGDDRISANPKLNNLVKGWHAARHDRIVMADSNLMLPPDYLRRLIGAWGTDTGLVSSPAIGTDARNLPAAIEAAFLNSHQARWQLLADEAGLGFAQGKTLAWQAHVLKRAGGLAALGSEVAEDVAATKVIRRLGLRVAVPQAAFAQPLGLRDWPEVWARQVRWARIRRAGFPALYATEVLAGSLPAVVAAGLAFGPAASAAFAVLWYAAEITGARRAGWIADSRGAAGILLRDLALPAVWLAGWRARGFNWRGTEMAASGRAVGAR